MEITEVEVPFSIPIQQKHVYESSFLIPESLANIIESIHLDDPTDKKPNHYLSSYYYINIQKTLFSRKQTQFRPYSSSIR